VEIARRKVIPIVTALHREAEKKRKLQNGGRKDLAEERAKKRSRKARQHMLQRRKSQMTKQTMHF